MIVVSSGLSLNVYAFLVCFFLSKSKTLYNLCDLPLCADLPNSTPVGFKNSSASNLVSSESKSTSAMLPLPVQIL